MLILCLENLSQKLSQVLQKLSVFLYETCLMLEKQNQWRSFVTRFSMIKEAEKF